MTNFTIVNAVDKSTELYAVAGTCQGDLTLHFSVNLVTCLMRALNRAIQADTNGNSDAMLHSRNFEIQSSR